MPHKYQLRNDGPGLLHHVTARVNWRAWHLDDDRAKQFLARLIQEAADTFGIDVLAAVLLSNHMHLSLRSPPKLLYVRHTSRRMPNRHYRPWPKGHQKSTVVAQFMRSVRHRMSLRRQGELGLSGRFWEGRYDTKPIEDRMSLVVRIAYDHRNPVKAGMVSRPEQYLWSTARTWSSGEVTPLPVLIRQPLPFGLTIEELRDAVLRYQGDERLDSMSKQLQTLWSCPGPVPDETWARLFGDHGFGRKP
jgi:putative transposase